MADDPALEPEAGPRGMDRYEKQGLLGEGANGVVYDARDRVSGHRVALKKVRMGKAKVRAGRECGGSSPLSPPSGPLRPAAAGPRPPGALPGGPGPTFPRRTGPRPRASQAPGLGRPGNPRRRASGALAASDRPGALTACPRPGPGPGRRGST